MVDIVVIVVIAAIGVLLCLATSQLLRNADDRNSYLATVRAVRWWMLPAAVGHVTVIVAVVVLLLWAVPPLRFGWWMLLGGSGNIALGQTGRTGAWWDVLAVGVPLWLLVLVPLLAHREEMTFRHGSEEDSRRQAIQRRVTFGLGHAVVMGVPVAAGIVLIGSGMIYELVYLKTLTKHLSRTTLATSPVGPSRVNYPPRPEGPYDPAAWRDHQHAVAQVGERNRQLLDEWIGTVTAQNRLREQQIDELRMLAATKAAALHAVTNWLVVGAVVTMLIATTY